MKEVHNIQEAQEHFLSNSREGVVCVKGDKKKECHTFPDAKAFFENKQKGKQVIKYYLHSDKESNYQYAEELGLDEEASDNFKYFAYEVELEVEVDRETGDAVVLTLDGRKLEPPKEEPENEE